MAWAIGPDGSNDYMTLASTVSYTDTQEFCIEIKFKIDAGATNDIMLLLDANVSNTLYYRQSTNQLRWTFGGSAVTISATPAQVLGNEINVSLKSNTSGHKFMTSPELGTSSTFTSPRVYSFSRFFGNTGGWYYHGICNHIKAYSDEAATTLVHDWKEQASDPGAGNPVWPDDTGTNDATGVGMPTDGSAWVDLGGGGGFQPAWAILANQLIW